MYVKIPEVCHFCLSRIDFLKLCLNVLTIFIHSMKKFDNVYLPGRKRTDKLVAGDRGGVFVKLKPEIGRYY